MARFAIAGLQLAVAARDNRYLIRQEVELALKRFPWVQMLVLGELAAFGSNPAAAEALPGETESFFCDLASEHDVWLVPGSMFERSDGEVYNTAMAINPQGEVVGRYRKIYPFLPYEKDTAPGDAFMTFEVPDVGQFGICICYDQWFPEVVRNLVWQGAEVILCPTMTNTVDRELELCLARANAIANQCYFFSINVAGELGNGQSMVVGPDGAVLHLAGEEPACIPLEVDFDHLRNVRERGVFGLGQPLKSFRDNPVAFPVYDAGARAQGALAELGDLALPRRRDNQK